MLAALAEKNPSATDSEDPAGRVEKNATKVA